MNSTYKRLGDYIEPYDVRAKNTSKLYQITHIKGISSISKSFVKTKANLVGVSADGYKVVYPRSFAYNPNTARMGDKIPIALNQGESDILVSSIYPTFRIKDENLLLGEYLLMWFKRVDFDRYTRFKSQGSARETFDWTEMCDVRIPIPSLEEQRKTVFNYQVVERRIKINHLFCDKIEVFLKTIYADFVQRKLHKAPNKQILFADILTPKRGQSITRATARPGKISVIAGGLTKSCTHDTANTAAPVVTISASGANAGFVAFHHTPVWASDCTFIDQSVFEHVAFAYVALKQNQDLLMSKQVGTGQPHIYAAQIGTIAIPDFSKEEICSMNSHFLKLLQKKGAKEQEIKILEPVIKNICL